MCVCVCVSVFVFVCVCVCVSVYVTSLTNQPVNILGFPYKFFSVSIKLDRRECRKQLVLQAKTLNFAPSLSSSDQSG